MGSLVEDVEDALHVSIIYSHGLRITIIMRGITWTYMEAEEQLLFIYDCVIMLGACDWKAL